MTTQPFTAGIDHVGLTVRDLGLTRDFFVAEADDHTCYWIYRERVGSRAEEDPRWFLHGLFG